MSRCPDPGILEQFAAGLLDEAAAAEVERHAEHCRKCAAAIGSHAAHQPLVDRVRDLARSREELGPALERLKEIENRISTENRTGAG